MNMKDIINHTAVSRILAGNDESIRRNKCPKKYQRKVDVLVYIVTRWVKWATKNQRYESKKI